MADRRRRRRKVDGSEESEEFSGNSSEEDEMGRRSRGDSLSVSVGNQDNRTDDLDTSTEVLTKDAVGTQGESEYESVEEDDRNADVIRITEKIRDVVVHDGLCLDSTLETDDNNPAEEEGGEEGEADMLDADCLDDDDEDDDDWKEGQREEGDGEESEIQNKEKVLDFDEDRRNPQYIPKKGGFYEHDDRLTEEPVSSSAATTAVEAEDAKKKGGKKKLWKDEGKWMHDRYQDGEQTPKSHDELVTVYGYDIRNEDGAPRARRRRRYGRGPSKYTRKWDDEDAYAKIIPQRGGSRDELGTPDSMNGPRGGGRGSWRDRGPRRGTRGFGGGSNRGGGGRDYRPARRDDDYDEETEGVDEESGGGGDSRRERRLIDDGDTREWPALGTRPQDHRNAAHDRNNANNNNDERPPNRNRRQQQQQQRDDRDNNGPSPRDHHQRHPQQQHQPREGSLERNDSQDVRQHGHQEAGQSTYAVRDQQQQQQQQQRRNDGSANTEQSYVQRRGRGGSRSLRSNYGHPPRGGRGGHAPRGAVHYPPVADRRDTREQQQQQRENDDDDDENVVHVPDVTPPVVGLVSAATGTVDRGGVELVRQMDSLELRSSGGESAINETDAHSLPRENRRETKTGTSQQQHSSAHDRRQASIPPRLQDAANRTKRYSSQRQRPLPDQLPYPGGGGGGGGGGGNPAPPPPSGPPHVAPSAMPPRFYETSYQPPIYPDHGPAANVQQGGGVLISPQAYSYDPSFQEAYVAGVRTMASPPRIFSSPVALATAGQPGIPAPYIAPTGNMMNYGPPPVPVTYQQIPYQQYPVPPPQVVVPQSEPLKSTLSALQLQPHEIFRGGMAYYNAQPPVRTLPNKRPRAAIPIVPPPEMEVHRRDDYEDTRESCDIESPVEDSLTESRGAVATPSGDVDQ